MWRSAIRRDGRVQPGGGTHSSTPCCPPRHESALSGSGFLRACAHFPWQNTDGGDPGDTGWPGHAGQGRGQGTHTRTPKTVLSLSRARSNPKAMRLHSKPVNCVGLGSYGRSAAHPRPSPRGPRGSAEPLFQCHLCLQCWARTWVGTVGRCWKCTRTMCFSPVSPLHSSAPEKTRAVGSRDAGSTPARGPELGQQLPEPPSVAHVPQLTHGSCPGAVLPSPVMLPRPHTHAPHTLMPTRL